MHFDLLGVTINFLCLIPGQLENALVLQQPRRFRGMGWDGISGRAGSTKERDRNVQGRWG